MKPILSGILCGLSIATFALAQGVATSGPTPPPELKKAIERFNTDVAAWNKRCKAPKTNAEDVWCKKERARIDGRKTELIALGGRPR